MKFPGAFVHPSKDGVSVTFTTFDDTDLSSNSEWTEAWQNEDPSLPAGFVHPAMILAQAARRLLELKPEFAEQLEAFRSRGRDAVDRNDPAREFDIRDPNDLGLLCLSLCEPIIETTRKRARKAEPALDSEANDEIPF